MKLNKTIYFILIFFSFFSCKQDNIMEEQGKLMVSSTLVNLDLNNQYAEITIFNGDGNYHVVSSNPAVAQYLLIEDKLIILGNNIGDAVIRLTDGKKNRADIKVKINQLIPRIVPVTTRLFLEIGDSKYIKNSQPVPLYYLPDTASVISLDGTVNNLQITGQNIGDVTLYYLSEYWPYRLYDISVVEHYPFIISIIHSQLIEIGTECDVLIASGFGNYEITVSDESIISPSILPVEIDRIYYNNPRIIKLKGLKAGDAKLNITNVDTSETESIDFRVINF